MEKKPEMDRIEEPRHLTRSVYDDEDIVKQTFEAIKGAVLTLV